MLIRLMLFIAIVTFTGTCHAVWDPNIEQLALLTARIQTTIDTTQNAIEYRALYNGLDEEGCHFVTIQRNGEPQGQTPLYEHFNFRICHDMIDDAAETPPEAPPARIDQVIQNVVAIAVREGKGYASYAGFQIIGNMLNDKEIEIKVMKGMILYMYVIRALK